MGKIGKNRSDQSIDALNFLWYFSEFAALFLKNSQKDPCPCLIDLRLRQSALSSG